MVNVRRFMSCSVLMVVCFVVQWFIFYVVLVSYLRHHNVCMSQEDFQALTKFRQNKGANDVRGESPLQSKVVNSKVIADNETPKREPGTLKAHYAPHIVATKQANSDSLNTLASKDHPVTYDRAYDALDGSAISSLNQLMSDKSGMSNISSDACGLMELRSPPLEYEKTRRRLRMGVEELWFFMTSEIKHIRDNMKTPGRIKSRLSKILDKGGEFQTSLLRDVEKLSEVDGFAPWRTNEEAAFSNLVQRRLQFLQNPADCQSAKKLVCSRPDCGFGCQMHHLVHCLIMAYGTQRAMIMSMQGLGQPGLGFEYLFLPLSTTCPLYSPIDDAVLPKWTGDNDIPVVLIPSLRNLTDPRSRRFCNPPSVPRDLVDSITKFHGLPIVWWVGQMLKYLTRLQPRIELMINHTSMFPKFKHPIVGVHVRRTDKIGYEAAYHPVEEYMNHVEEYFARLSLFHQNGIQKRIFLASDEAGVFQEIQDKYPSYEIVGDPGHARWAGNRFLREHSKPSLHGIITDLYFLANSDFLVCTYSSQFCRQAYELMQSLTSNAVHRFRSLDDWYYFGGQGIHTAVTVLNHKASTSREIDLKVGDLVEMKGNLWNGYALGRNLRSNVTGTFPYFKVQDVIKSEDCPTYEQVPLKEVNRKELDELD